MKTPIVTIVGRPNTGKSTLFNRLIGKRVAIVSEEAGTTRDRLFHKVETPELDFFLVDTGGLTFGKGKETIENNMTLQAKIAMEEADMILFVVEGKGELTKKDFEVAELLRKTSGKKPILLIASKCDQPLTESELAPFYKLGLCDPHETAAQNKVGTSELLARIVETLKSRSFKKATEKEKYLNVALVGRPNVGKSSLINALLKKEKLIVSVAPGTTRDATDTLVKHEGKTYNFIDTAGLRRQSKRERGIEHFSALRSMAAIERCDIALLVLDSSEPLSQQDQQIGHYVVEAGKGLVLLANKWDLKVQETGLEKKPAEKERALFLHKLQFKFPFTPWAPVIFTSAATKKNLSCIFEQVEVVQREREKRLFTHPLNTFVQKLLADHAPTGTKKTRPKIFYLTQVDVKPPTFAIFINKKAAFHFSYWRYLENRLREHFGFIGTPLKFIHREKERRYRSSTQKQLIRDTF